MDVKIDKMLLVFQATGFDIVPADSKYYKENTCHRELMFNKGS